MGPRGKCEPVSVDNDFTLDAARVYISQRADVDTYFRLPKGNVGSTSWEEPRSTVALKADTLRLVARENIKFVTRTNKFNSQGGALGNSITSGYGIDLIACNDTGALQPMVRGENLRELLQAMLEMMSSLTSTFGTYVSETRKLHTALIKHTHLSPFYGSPTAPDFQSTIPDGINVLINNVTNVDVGNMGVQQAYNQLIMEYLSQTGVETIPLGTGPKVSKNILSPYNSNN